MTGQKITKPLIKTPGLWQGANETNWGKRKSPMENDCRNSLILIVFNEGIFTNAGSFFRCEIIHIKLLEISSNKDVKAQEEQGELSQFCEKVFGWTVTLFP